MKQPVNTTNSSEAGRGTKSLEEQFINHLVTTRLAMHIQQGVLAQKAGLPQSAVARIESGKGNPTLKTLNKLADAMGYEMTLLRKQD